ncbi:MAG: MmgE/PrpD family protein [Gammaproteobacteria bacterium]|nr:MmgE/PrpD family protein [Gammaproteobacteria bacterium]
MTAYTYQHIDFIETLAHKDIPAAVVRKAEYSLLDCCGVTLAGSRMRAADIMQAFARRNLSHDRTDPGAFKSRLLFDGRAVSPGGAALAAGQAADSMDAHDGFHQIKGSHISATLFAGLLSLVDAVHDTPELPQLNGSDLFTAWIIGQEVAIRFGCALQSTRPDTYIPSGLIGAIGIAAMGGRILNLNHEQINHAFGIAELHGPRIQTENGWRVTIVPSMLKDTISWGAMAGVNAVLLARDGFTGAPCGIIQNKSLQSYFDDFVKQWFSLNLYMKPLPCCRYSVPAVRGILQLLRLHHYVDGIDPNDVAEVTVTTFHEAWLLGRNIQIPDSAEVAQYHVAWPVAAALVSGRLPGPQQMCDHAVASNTHIQKMCSKIKIETNNDYTSVFPQRTLADVRIKRTDGSIFELLAKDVCNDDKTLDADEMITFNHADPDLGICSGQDVLDKFDRYASWAVGVPRAEETKRVIFSLRGGGQMAVNEFLAVMLSGGDDGGTSM